MALLARQIAPLTFATALISEVDPVAAGDLDGDGDDELIARLADDDDRGWVLGLGDARTPVLPGPGPVPAAQLPAAPLDPAIERAWRGALDLASMGLRGAAAEELEATARLAATPDARAQMLSRAGELWRGEGRAERAASAYEAALRQRDPANGAAVTRDTLGAARSWLDAHALEAAAAHLARIDGAAGAAGEEARATLAWLRPLLAEAASPIDVVDGGRLAPELKLRVPEAVARDRDGVGALRVDAFAGAGAVAVLPVRYAGGRVTIALELETEHAEIGAGLDVALRRPGEGEAALQLSFGVSGGGLVSDRVMGCGPWIDRAAPVWQQPTGPVDGLTHVTYELDFMPDPGGTRCVVRDVAGAVTRVDRHYRSRALPPGDYELVIRAGPPVPWDTVMWSRLTLRRLVVGGLTVRSVAPGPLERARPAWLNILAERPSKPTS